jgi:RNase P protein component
LLPKRQRLTGKDVIFMTRKRQYIWQGLFGFFYIKQYANIQYNQFSCHITIKLSKRSVVRHMFKRAIIQRIQQHNLIKFPINNTFYKFFIVLSKDRIPEIEKKIANFQKKDTIKYIQDEFEKSWKWVNDRMYQKRV